MALKHDFWSILGHKTYFARGRLSLKANKVKVSAMPVAMGTINAAWAERTPEVHNNKLWY